MHRSAMRLLNTAPSVVIVALLCVGAAAGSAQAGEALARSHACTACHAMGERLIGPSFREISQRYAGQPEAQALLVRSIKHGSSGRWGTVPMPASPQVTETDAQALVAWILHQK